MCGLEGVNAYLVFAISVYELEVLKGLNCVDVLPALLGHPLRARLDQILHESHGLLRKKHTQNNHQLHRYLHCVRQLQLQS